MENKKISIIGLGYVGLPLAVLFAKKHRVIGYDINSNRIDELNNFIDSETRKNHNALLFYSLFF